MPAALSNTTISAAITKEQKTIPLTSVTGVAVENILVLGGEAMCVTEIVGTTAVNVLRGCEGTHSRAHSSGAVAWFGPPNYFTNRIPTGTAVSADEVVLPKIVLAGGSARCFRILNSAWVELSTRRLAGYKATDDATGYEYALVDCQSAFQIGEWVAIDGEGLASQLGTGTKGRVGIIIETVSASDTLAWAITVGTYASALLTSSVTTACVLIAGTGAANIGTSTGGNVIFNATCTVAPSTATSPTVGEGVGTVVLVNPYCYGITTDIVP